MAEQQAIGAAPRYARPFVALFLALLVGCALVPLNLWPFSNWELFSRLRSARISTWDAVAVNRSGRVTDFAVATIPRADRNATCRTWLRGDRDVAVYRVERLLSARVGSHAAPPRLTLVWTCSKKGAHGSS